jgi:tetratricopeptide (TPR) repeat protein
MRRAAMLVGALLLVVATGVTLVLSRGARQAAEGTHRPEVAGYAGSGSCRDCHESFYRLWSTSHHGLTMRPWARAAAGREIAPQTQDIVVADRRYRADIEKGNVRETTATGEVWHPIAYLMGGKNVDYFLTPYQRGRLQVLPVAYDLRRKEWYDVSASALRHFADVSERALEWTDPELTFNAACHGCHVSQLRSNYDLATDSYRTTWAEPGIGCETCHGPGEEHVRLALEAGPGKVPVDLKLISAKRLTHEQRTDMCAACHARMSPVANSFHPGDRFFDAFDLVGLESRDFYPDGRDLGENYTFTGWRMSPCARSGQLDCLHCHTSSGRYRFEKPAEANQACLPCHAVKVRDVLAHSRHPGGQATCIACHMPKTEFARMARSDHSMRPPAPAATLAFGSPNACNQCHQDKDGSWSDREVRKWHAHDYQKPTLRRASLIAAARKEDWSELSAMLDAVTGSQRHEVTAAGLLRLLRRCPSATKWPAVLAALADPSPWVRAAAAEAAGDHLTPSLVGALLTMTRDPVRLPRVRAAAALAGLASSAAPEAMRADLMSATRELEASLAGRPDDFAAQLDLARLHESRGDRTSAIAAYQAAIRLRPDLAAPLVNLSLVYHAVGKTRDAEDALRRALSIEPSSLAANLNLGMLLGELGRLPEAEAALRTAVRADPRSAVAAYNLAVVVSRDRLDEAVALSRRAAELDPASPKYAYTSAFYLAQRGDKQAAASVLRRALDGQAASADCYLLLASLLVDTGRKGEAEVLLRSAAADARLSPADRSRLARTQASAR